MNSPRNRLLDKIAAVNDGLTLAMPLPVVSVAAFFDGNDDRSSLAVHAHDDNEAFRTFRDKLLAIQAAPGVVAVLVEIYELEEGNWPYSERVYVVASHDADAVLVRCRALAPSDIGEGWFEAQPPGAPALAPGDRVFSLWWD